MDYDGVHCGAGHKPGTRLGIGCGCVVVVTRVPRQKLSEREVAVQIDYTNWKGERAIRTIIPHYVVFDSNEWHPKPQWLLVALDVERDEVRAFAQDNIHSWVNRPLPPV